MMVINTTTVQKPAHLYTILHGHHEPIGSDAHLLTDVQNNGSQ